MPPVSCQLLQPPLTGRRSAIRAAQAFTLIELLVVIGIIVLLVALLIPALGRVRNNSRASQTLALMTQIGQAIDSYYGMFNAYPGPIPTSLAPSNPGYPSIPTTANVDSGTKVMSGSQNLLLGLSYAMTPNTGAFNFSIPGSSPALFVDTSHSVGPINYAALQASGLYPQLPAFFSPTLQQLSTPISPNVWPAGGIAGASGTSFAFPVITDTFPDALPILYYRRTPGVTSPVTSGNVATVAAYYVAENQEYTNAAALIAADGSSTNQAASAFSAAALQTIVQTADGSSARGGYLLMSTGIDRLYGAVNHAGVTDNITFIGGN